mmetsp:Transcript_17462/g.25653  ORF Transcript_17462/g.25653 Transcript_17462/m.25653 type:complete len:622 (+) Transcript_17462:148-2013(+)
MGGCLAKNHLLSDTAVTGSQKDYEKRYVTSRLLGQGEFGAVHLVHDMTQPNTSRPLASKILKKGLVFDAKDSTLHFPMNPKVMQTEVSILQTLQGQCYNIQLVGVYETPSIIYLVTEYCQGGDMLQYLSQTYHKITDGGIGGSGAGLRTEDVSRIAYQLLSAVHHCNKHNVLHRDIKPENIMFCDAEIGSQLRLIDFGSGTIDHPSSPASPSSGDENGNNRSKKNLIYHETFAGTPFYISPQVFRRHYTAKTDIWSVGVTLYVLVAGYPANQLQKVFNMLQNASRTSLRTLPNIPDDMPDSYWDMLERCLAYKPKERGTAKDVLNSEFVQFHRLHHKEKKHDSDTDNTSSSTTTETIMTRVPTKSLLLPLDTTKRHTTYLDYRSYERSVTTLIAAMLSPDQFRHLLGKLATYHDKEEEPMYGLCLEDYDASTDNSGDGDNICNKKKLRVISIKELKTLLHELCMEWVVERMEFLSQSANYDDFAYSIEKLQQFSNTRGGGDKKSNDILNDSTRSEKISRKASTASTAFSRRISSSIDLKDLSLSSEKNETSLSKRIKKGIQSNLSFLNLNELSNMDDSIKSGKSFSGGTFVGKGKERNISSVHGGNVWDTLMKSKRLGSGQ